MQAPSGERNRQLVQDFWQAVYEKRDEDRSLAIGHAAIESFDHEVHSVVVEGDTLVTVEAAPQWWIEHVAGEIR